MSMQQHRNISNLLEYYVPRSMLNILQEQRISEDDLRTLDRDDVDHLFKNESGFTFRDRKQFWTTIQTLKAQILANQSTHTHFRNGISDQHESHTIEYQNNNSIDPSHTLLVSSIMSSTNMCFDPNSNTKTSVAGSENILLTGNDEKYLQTQISTPSNCTEHCAPATPNTFEFTYPVELPQFSPRVTRALQANNMEKTWRALITDLTRWILSLTSEPLGRREVQAIGESVYKQYPCTGREGYRPWSYLCSALTRRLRTQRLRRKLAEQI